MGAAPTRRLPDCSCRRRFRVTVKGATGELGDGQVCELMTERDGAKLVGIPKISRGLSGADAEGKGRPRCACSIMDSSEGDGGDKGGDGPSDSPQDQERPARLEVTRDLIPSGRGLPSNSPARSTGTSKL